MKIQRFEVIQGEMCPSPSGEYMLVSDHERLIKAAEAHCDMMTARGKKAEKMLAEQQGVPDGWRLVPVKLPTHLLDKAITWMGPAMRDGDRDLAYCITQIWNLFLDSAPTPPAGGQTQKDAGCGASMSDKSACESQSTKCDQQQDADKVAGTLIDEGSKSAQHDATDTPINDKSHPRFMAGYVAGMKDSKLSTAQQDVDKSDGQIGLNLDEQRLAVWQAIEAITIGNKWDDKLIVQKLHESGYVIARYGQPGPAMAGDDLSDGDILQFLRDHGSSADVYIDGQWAYMDKLKLIRLSIDHLRVQPATNDDSTRLDWIEKNARRDPKMDGNHVYWPTAFNQTIRGPSLREAIDRAMQQERKP